MEVILVDNTYHQHDDDNHYDNTTSPSFTYHSSSSSKDRFHRPIVHDHDRKRDHNDWNDDCVRKSGTILRKRGSRDDNSSCGDSSSRSSGSLYSSYAIDDDYNNLDCTFLDIVDDEMKLAYESLKLLHGDNNQQQVMARSVIESIKDGLEVVTSCVGHEKISTEDKSNMVISDDEEEEEEEEAGTSKDGNLFRNDSKLLKGKDISTRLTSDEEDISSELMIRTPILRDNDSFDGGSISSYSEKKDMLTKQREDIKTQMLEDNEEPIPKISTHKRSDPPTFSTVVKARRVVYGHNKHSKKKSKNKRSKAIINILLGENVTSNTHMKANQTPPAMLEEKGSVHDLSDRWNKNHQMPEEDEGLNPKTSTKNRISDRPSVKARRVVHCRDGGSKKKSKKNRSSEALIDIFSNKTTASTTYLPSSAMPDNQEEACSVPIPSDRPLDREPESMMTISIIIRDGNEEKESKKDILKNNLEDSIKSEIRDSQEGKEFSIPVPHNDQQLESALDGGSFSSEKNGISKKKPAEETSNIDEEEAISVTTTKPMVVKASSIVYHNNNSKNNQTKKKDRRGFHFRSRKHKKSGGHTFFEI